MNYAETMAKSQALDRALTRPLGETMPEVGGRSLAGGLRSMMDGVRQAADAAQKQIADELRGMADDIKQNSEIAVRKIRDERAETNKAFSDLLGNEMAGTGANDGAETK